MSEQLTPRPYSDRELTLRAISLTFQRAQAIQQGLTASPPPETPTEDWDEISERHEPEPQGELDQPDEPEELDRPEEPSEPEEGAGLPNPIVTDSNLRHFLDQAMNYRGDPDSTIGRGTAKALKAVAQGQVDQARFNTAVLHALHQLDHRTRLQERTIAELEAELADARRALAALEANEVQS